MSAATPAAAQSRSLISKFRRAVLLPGLGMIAIGLGVFVPTLAALSHAARERRDQAARSVIDSGVNNMARLLAMEFGAWFLPALWEAADRSDRAEQEVARLRNAADTPPGTYVAAIEELDSANTRLDLRSDRLDERVAEKISYNGVLVDLVVAVPHIDPRQHRKHVFLYPTGNTRVANVSFDELAQLGRVKGLVRLGPSKVGSASAGNAARADLALLPAGKFVLVDYLRSQAAALDAEAYLMPIRREGVPYGYAGIVVKTGLISEQFEGQWREFWRGLEMVLIGLGLLALAGFAAGGLLVSRLATRLIRPLKGMRSALAGVPLEGPIDTPDLERARARLDAVDADPLDEIGALRNTFAAMAENLGHTLAQKAEALQRVKEMTALAERQKVEGWRQMSRAITHSMKTPLGTLRLRLERLKDAAMAPGPAEMEKLLGVVEELHQRLSDLVDFVKLEVVVSAGDLNQVVSTSLANFEPHRRPSTAINFLPHSQPLVARIAPAAVQLALVNLLSNAQESGASTITVTTEPAADGQSAELRIEDDGPGVPDEVRAALFEHPLNSTKPSGSGLGAALVKYIIEQHQGRLVWTSPLAAGRGTRVVLFFPFAPSRVEHS